MVDGMADGWSAVPEWIRKAKADWAAAQALYALGDPELSDAVVFHAQQCIEKLLKARLIQLGQSVQKLHDLVSISRSLHAVDSLWDWSEDDLSDLSSGAVLVRYPGFDATLEDAGEMLSLADAMRAALLLHLGVQD